MKRNRYSDLLKEKAFLSMVAANTTSAVGTKLHLMALPIYLYQVTGKVESLGLMMAAETVPWIIFGPLFGQFVDRIDRKRLLMLSNLIASIILFFYFNASIYLLYVLAFILGCANTCLASANGSVLPMFIPKDKFKLGFSLYNLFRTLVDLTIPAIGGILIMTISPRYFFIIDGTSYLLAAGMIYTITFPDIRRNEPVFVVSSLITNVSKEFKVMRKNINLIVPLRLELVKTFLEAVTFPLLVILILELFSYPKYYYSFVISAIGIGDLVGTFIAGKLFIRKRSLQYIIYGSLLYFASYLLLVQNVNVIYLLGVVIVGNIGNGILTVEIHNSFGVETRDATRGTAIAIINCLIALFYVFGYLAASPMSKVLGIKGVYYVFTLTSIVLFCLVLTVKSKSEYRNEYDITE